MNDEPKDILLIGDSMISKLKTDNFPHKIWKFSYSGGRAQEMLNHLPCERLPGESRIRDIILHAGTNDVSRARGLKNTVSDIETYLTKLIDLLSKMYPQARIIYSCILPRMDNDHNRTIQVNTIMKSKILNENKQELFDFRDFCGHYSEQCSNTLQNVPNSRFFRNSQNDKVHFSDEGKDLFQSLFFYLVGELSATQRTFQLEDLMWQRDWDQWRFQNFPDAKPTEYLSNKLLTNFTDSVHQELLEYENQLIAKLISNNREPEHKSKQNSDTTESKHLVPSASTIPSRKDAVRKKMRERKEKQKNDLIPSRISKNQTVEDSVSSKQQEDNENARLGSPRNFYNHGNKKPASPSDNSQPRSSSESESNRPIEELVNTESRLEIENDSAHQYQNKYIPKRNHSKFKTRDDNSSDDDSLQKALSNLKIRHHA